MRYIQLGDAGYVEVADDASATDIEDFLKSEQFRNTLNSIGFVPSPGALPEPSLFEAVGDAFKAGAAQGLGSIANILGAGGLLSNDTVANISKSTIEYAGKQATSQSYVDAFNSKDFWTGASTFLKDPLKNTAYLISNGIGTSIPSILLGVGAAAAVGTGPVSTSLALAGGVGIGSFLTESGASIMEDVIKSGADPFNPASYASKLADPNFMQEATRRGVIKGAVTGGFDAASAGLAGKLLANAAGKGFLSYMGRAGGEVGMQAAAGAAGEALGEIAQGDTPNAMEVAAEALGEIGAGAPEILFGARAYRHLRPVDDIEKEIARRAIITDTADDGKEVTIEGKTATFRGLGSYDGKPAAFVNFPDAGIAALDPNLVKFPDPPKPEAQSETSPIPPSEPAPTAAAPAVKAPTSPVTAPAVDQAGMADQFHDWLSSQPRIEQPAPGKLRDLKSEKPFAPSVGEVLPPEPRLISIPDDLRNTLLDVIFPKAGFALPAPAELQSLPAPGPKMKFSAFRKAMAEGGDAANNALREFFSYSAFPAAEQGGPSHTQTPLSTKRWQRQYLMRLLHEEDKTGFKVVRDPLNPGKTLEQRSPRGQAIKFFRDHIDAQMKHGDDYLQRLSQLKELDRYLYLNHPDMPNDLSDRRAKVIYSGNQLYNKRPFEQFIQEYVGARDKFNSILKSFKEAPVTNWRQRPKTALNRINALSPTYGLAGTESSYIWPTPQEGQRIFFQKRYNDKSPRYKYFKDPADPNVRWMRDSIDDRHQWKIMVDPTPNVKAKVLVWQIAKDGKVLKNEWFSDLMEAMQYVERQELEQKTSVIQQVNLILKDLGMERLADRIKYHVTLHTTPQKVSADSSGYYLPVHNAIGIVYRQVGLGLNNLPLLHTVSHELIHFWKNTEVITPQEWTVLSKAARDNGWINRYEIDQHYPGEGELLKIEEAVAEAFSDYYMTRSPDIIRGIDKTLFERVMDKIMQFFDAIKKAIGLEIQKNPSAKEIFDEILSGGMSLRSGMQQDLGGAAADKSKAAIFHQKYTPDPTDEPIESFEPMRDEEWNSLDNNLDEVLKTLEKDREVIGRDLSAVSRYINSARHVAAKYPVFAFFWQFVDAKRRHTYEIVNRASEILKGAYETATLEDIATLDKAIEISQLVPGRYTKNPKGDILFAAPPSGGIGKNSRVAPNEVVVLSGKNAEGYLKIQEAVRTILEEEKKGLIISHKNLLNRTYRLLGHNITSPGVLSALRLSQLESLKADDIYSLHQQLEGEVRGMIFTPEGAPTFPITEEAIRKALADGSVPQEYISFLQRAWDVLPGLKDLSNQIYKMEVMGQKDYAPLQRQGSHYIRVVQPVANKNGVFHPKVVHLEFVETGLPYTQQRLKKLTRPIDIAAIEKRKKELLLKYPGAEITVGDNTLDSVRQNLGENAVYTTEMLGQLIREGGREGFNQVARELQEQMSLRGFKRHWAHRTMLPGYDTNFRRSITDYIIGGAHYSSGLRFNPDIARAYAFTQKAQGERVRDYARRFYEYVMNPAEEMQTLRKFQYFWYLGGVPVAALIQIFGLVQMAPAHLAQFTSVPQVTALMGKAFADTNKMLSWLPTSRQYHDVLMNFAKAPQDVYDDVLRAASEGIIKFGSTLEDSGMSSANISLEQAALSRGVVGFERFIRTSKELLTSSFSTIESYGRTMTFIAANRFAQNPANRRRINEVLKDHQLWNAMRKGADDFTPYDFARFVVDDVFAGFGKEFRAPIMRKLGSAVFQFQTYPHQMMELLWRMLSRHGGSGKKAFAIAMLMLLVTGGLRGLPGADDAFDLVDWATKNIYPGLDYQLKATTREMLADTYGGNRFMEELTMSGLPNALGVDLTNRISLGTLPGLNQLKAALGMSGDGSAVFGVPASLTITNLRNAFQLAQEGRFEEALMRGMPNFLKNPWEGFYVYPHEGVRTLQGVELKRPEDLSKGDIFIRAFGATPTSIGLAREFQYVQNALNTNVAVKQERVTAKAEQAYYEYFKAVNMRNLPAAHKSLSELAVVQRELFEYNVRAPAHLRITGPILTTARERAIMRLFPDRRFERVKKGGREFIKDLKGVYK